MPSPKLNLRDVVLNSNDTQPIVVRVQSKDSSPPSDDSMRSYENCSYSEVLQGKRMSFSPTWVRRALAWCAAKQVSAHRLPRTSSELIGYMHAVGWNVTDPDLFTPLATKLLAWTARWITNKNLSPAMTETKKNLTAVRFADWSSVWASYTTEWIDVDFVLDFELGKSSPRAPKGRKHLPERLPVERPWQTANGLVEAAANVLRGNRFKTGAGDFVVYNGDDAVDDEKHAVEACVVEDEDAKDSATEAEDKQAEDEGENEEHQLTDPDSSPAPIATTTKLPPAVNTTLFDEIIRHPAFMDWYYDIPADVEATMESIFAWAKDNPTFREHHKKIIREKKMSEKTAGGKGKAKKTVVFGKAAVPAAVHRKKKKTVVLQKAKAKTHAAGSGVGVGGKRV
ncbi:uncharacterized protein MYCGRDRAFT_97907 [Zymoseptoria tritici IPO323]|uniref:Uncharacterized protein n=1 Tax=Zymoseptoria tritici (strain CBS 115943 / IPO323) TaxID=336722 RepID=F9XRR2_ZYMTI|nr:uncharacterized protein MYCGRDRAFT_97907 [Zymoseptoria tritici IPO323]EGP82088.1 hypothetical protein MYCGRDRAFT_97907 [Zymoseptoria tritici IPO323]